ncbi:MAG: hypothetical protein IJR67_03145 [Acholeplasmatales bacterium]|nr:hypothetical protein [Acholeplasmatales bacterium]
MKRIISLFFILSMMVVASSCANSDIIFNDNAESLLKEDFVENNKISGAFYTYYFEENEIPESIGSDLIHDESGYYTVFYQYNDCPRERQFIIESDEDFRNVFKDDSSIELNFEKQRIVLYTYASYYRQQFLFDKIIVENDTIICYYYRYHKKATGDGGPPYQRWIYIVCNKTDISKYSFSYYEIEYD